VMKAATSSVFAALEQEGLVCPMSEDCPAEASKAKKGEFHVSPIKTGKEAHTFSCTDEEFDDLMANKWKITKCYKPDTCDRHFIDATPVYIMTPDAPKRMATLLPTDFQPYVRLLVLVREPISRTVSHFNMAAGTIAAANAGESSGGLNHGMNGHVFCVDDAPDGIPSFAEEMACDKKRQEECFDAKLKLMGNALSFASLRHASHSDTLQSVYDQCVESDDSDAQWGMLYRGLYSPQIRWWVDEKKGSSFSRSQLMVVDFDAVVNDTKATLERIGSFYGLGKVAIDALPQRNQAEDGWGADFTPVETIDCKTKDMLADFFKEWNAQLVTDLQKAYNATEAPSEEPYWEGFGESSIECK